MAKGQMHDPHTKKSTTLVSSDEIHRESDFCPHAVLSVVKKNKKTKKIRRKKRRQPLGGCDGGGPALLRGSDTVNVAVLVFHCGFCER